MILKKALLAVAILSIVGCTQVSRQLGNLTDNKFAQPRSGTTWITPPPQLDPPSLDARKVYISFRDISDAGIDLTEVLRGAAQSQGWQVTSDPNDAPYRLRASMRFFGEVQPESGGRTAAASLGIISGAAVGIGAGVLTNEVFNSRGAGTAVGGIAGGLIAAGIANGSKPREWSFIIDFVLEEYSEDPVEFIQSSNNSSSASTATGVGNSRTSDFGGTTNSNSRSGTITKKSNYFPHGIRLSAWANQMNMKKEEAFPLLQDRVRRIMAQMLPV